MKMIPEERSPLDAPEWFAERCEELSRLMSSTPRSVANGLWFELIKRHMVNPQPVPGRVMGPLGWKPQALVSEDTLTTNSAG